MKKLRHEIVQRTRGRGTAMRCIFSLLGLLTLALPTQAASFDCGKATSRVERLVCDTPVISMLDDYLRQAYLEIMDKTNEEQKQNLINEQKIWLLHTRNKCAEKSCLKQVYLSRIKELEVVSEKMPAIVAEKAEEAVSTTQVTPRLVQTAPASLEEIQQLLNMAHKQLREKQRGARDILFFSGGMPKDKTGYCRKFWNTLNTQDTFDIPKPDMLAVTPQEKEKLFEVLHGYANRNFDRFIAQDGKLTPNEYTDAEGKTRRFIPFFKGKTNDPRYLAQKFEGAWQNTADYHSFFHRSHLLDDSLSTHILYMQPYPIAGYVRPLVVTVVRDQCDKCTGISMGVRVVSVTGLPQPELLAGEYFSQAGFADAVTNASRLHTSMPQGPFLLMGLGVFNGQPIFWTLKRPIWAKPSAKAIDEEIGYENGDGFRDYQLNVMPLDAPGYGLGIVCSVKFN